MIFTQNYRFWQISLSFAICCDFYKIWQQISQQIGILIMNIILASVYSARVIISSEWLQAHNDYML